MKCIIKREVREIVPYFSNYFGGVISRSDKVIDYEVVFETEYNNPLVQTIEDAECLVIRGEKAEVISKCFDPHIPAMIYIISHQGEKSINQERYIKALKEHVDYLNLQLERMERYKKFFSHWKSQHKFTYRLLSNMRAKYFQDLGEE